MKDSVDLGTEIAQLEHSHFKAKTLLEHRHESLYNADVLVYLENSEDFHFLVSI